MGSHYRNREGRTTIASTTSSDVTGLGASAPQAAANDVDLDNMTRLELLEHARDLGLDIKQNTAKADIRAAIDNA